MAQVTVQLPSLLHHCTDGEREIALDAGTLDEALQTLIARHPLLEVHVFEGNRKIRRFVLIFHNEDDIRRLESWDVPLADGDRITILQSVAGG